MNEHSTAEDNYVLAESHATPMDGPTREDITIEPSVTAEDDSTKDTSKDSIPASTFTYKPTEELFQATKTAEVGSPESYWSHTLYRGPVGADGDAPKVKVHYCTSLHTSERVVSRYLMSEKVVGFDIEWKMVVTRHAGPKENVSLIQLATEERVILIHIALFAKDNVSALVAPSFKKLMENPDVSKVGVNIKGDCTRLRNNLSIDSKGVFELSHLYKLIKYSTPKDYKLINKKPVSMATQVLEHLHLPMFKGMDVRGSDWSKKLNMDQITYAAGDSYAGLQLYNVMDLKRTNQDPVHPLPYHAELNKPIRLAEGVELDTDPNADAEEEAVDITSSVTQKRARKAPLPKSDVQEESDLDSDSSDSAFEPSQHFHPSALISKTPSSRSAAMPSTKQGKVLHPLLLAAEDTMTKYQASLALATPETQATNAHLRAYFVWSENPELSIRDVAKVLRSPPLADRTVQSYVLEAIRLDGKYLNDGDWDRERVKTLLKEWKAGAGNQGWVAKRYWLLEKELQ